MSTTPGTNGSTPGLGTSPSGTTMRAIVQDEYGEAEVLRPDEVARPTIGDAEVLVGVRAAGLDRGTWHLMSGKPYLARLALGLRRPRNRVLGRDVAGVVEAVGADVTRFTVGDEVFGICGGSFAEYAAVREDKLALKPPTSSFAQAAVLGISGITALHAVRDSGKVTAGQQVLVIGASGGVGTFAVQIAAAYGAEVTGVCSAAKADLVRSLGAVHVVDYASEDFAAGSPAYDVIIDIAGNSPLSRLRRALAPRGTLVIVGGEGGDLVTGGMHRQLGAALLSPFVGQRLVMLFPRENHQSLEDIAALVAAGTLSPAVDATYPLADAPDAMRRLESGEVRGKIAIVVAGVS